ncbi:MAG: outer membrane protein assembly factor BamD [Bacteroidales bacterium]|nr:outer membrane protein assembly factor BamD [Bacteroidales bacterium]
MHTVNARVSVLAGMFFLILMMSACSQYQRLLKSDDYELKYATAIEYYEEGNYGRAIALLMDVIPLYRGTAEAERINYYFAMAHFKMGDYTLASHYFKTFANAFPRSEHAEEFLYLSAYCLYLESPRYSLDQTNTLQAIRELQAFINRFPYSERVEDANELIDELRYKLEKKRFETGKLYLNISDYVAAATSFEAFIRDYPDTRYREEATFLIIKAYFEFAYNSIPQRQEERYEKVINAFNTFQRRYPDSRFMRDARRMNEHAANAVLTFQNNRSS